MLHKRLSWLIAVIYTVTLEDMPHFFWDILFKVDYFSKLVPLLQPSGFAKS